ncbi:Iron-sulfur cluster assembly protein CyaY [Buchnera aphidicola (Cinara pseudotaxifoliae)]|uniref:Iron-sulfur cluster assembly protein CyaY n=1 Tax=Buchnera aphidicola (Cinara pseudotaxifoliae) TaxID=655384 RepID=A0A451DI06_9GAMM|nr:iron donor protein CyaY [Buchnera aphidicola]VFP86278.1 Iron-sulfur cluster assembly protein CyaY [Buchnera aphidicola (Cinara pseudotaxifoliae)]
MHDIMFHKKIKKTLSTIEEVLNNNNKNIDFDYLLLDNMLEITFSNNKKIILTSQIFLKQLWIATSNQGYHLLYKKRTWICIRSKKTIKKILKKEFFIQTNYLFKLNLLNNI